MAAPEEIGDQQSSLNRFVRRCAVTAVAFIAAASGISLGIVIDAVNHLNSDSLHNRAVIANIDTKLGCEDNGFNHVLEELFHEKPITAPPTC